MRTSYHELAMITDSQGPNLVVMSVKFLDALKLNSPQWVNRHNT